MIIKLLASSATFYSDNPFTPNKLNFSYPNKRIWLEISKFQHTFAIPIYKLNTDHPSWMATTLCWVTNSNCFYFLFIIHAFLLKLLSANFGPPLWLRAICIYKYKFVVVVWNTYYRVSEWNFWIWWWNHILFLFVKGRIVFGQSLR